MLIILSKELKQFFNSLIGTIALVVFLLASGLFMWVFPDTSVLEYGYATADMLFFIGPWVFMFLIPAITMRSFAEENKSGTIELLATKPIWDWQIITGKYLASLVLVIFSLLPTLFYYYSIYQLGSPIGNIDTGATLGSYLGLLMIGATFAAIGIFASSLTENQIVAFILSLFLCFFIYMGFEFASTLGIFYGTSDSIVKYLGMNEHYASISRGVLDTKDVIYFVSVILAFLFATQLSLENRKR